MSKIHGFSLLEVLATLVVITTAMGFTLPVWKGSRDSLQRDQAIRLAMGVLQNARHIAIATGLETHVLLQKQELQKQAALLIFQTKDIVDRATNTSPRLLSKWIPLPPGYSWQWKEARHERTDDFPKIHIPSSFPSLPSDADWIVLSFGPTGNVTFPPLGPLKLQIGNLNHKETLFDTIHVARFSGRTIWEGEPVD